MNSNPSNSFAVFIGIYLVVEKKSKASLSSKIVMISIKKGGTSSKKQTT